MTKKILKNFEELKALLPQETKSNTIKKPKKEKKSSLANKTKPKPVVDPKLQAIFDALNWLKATFPKAFLKSHQKIKPLKVGIGQDIIEFVKEKEERQVSLTRIRKALAMYTNSINYLKACSKSGCDRVDLNGLTVDKVSDSQAQYALEKLKNKQAQKQLKETPVAKESQSHS